MIITEIGSESKVLKALKTIENVEEAYLVYGVYDILAKVTTKNMDELEEIITSHLLRSNVVKSSTTMIVIPPKQSLNTRTEEVFTCNV
jgi:DNA-binding Lrp family transcriptional regulator